MNDKVQLSSKFKRKNRFKRRKNEHVEFSSVHAYAYIFKVQYTRTPVAEAPCWPNLRGLDFDGCVRTCVAKYVAIGCVENSHDGIVVQVDREGVAQHGAPNPRVCVVRQPCSRRTAPPRGAFCCRMNTNLGCNHRVTCAHNHIHAAVKPNAANSALQGSPIKRPSQPHTRQHIHSDSLSIHTRPRPHSCWHTGTKKLSGVEDDRTWVLHHSHT